MYYIPSPASMRHTLCLLIATGISLAAARASTPVITSPLPDLFLSANGASLDLSQYFNADAVSNDLVRVFTSQGDFNMQLLPDAAPATVANFLDYVNAGAYENMIVHRSIPGFVIQTGGYYTSGAPVPTFAPVTNEFGISNTQGTVAMAKLGGDPNSATSQWFINLADNSQNLDNQNGGFTVFAKVIGDGMNVVSAISSLPLYNLGSPFDSIPLKGVTNGQTALQRDNLVTISRVATLPYFATSSDPNAVSTTVIGNSLSLSFVSYTNIPTMISVYAYDTNGNTVMSSFAVTTVPEPGEVILLGFGLILILIVKHRSPV